MPHYKQIEINGTRHTYHRYLMEQHLGRKLSKNEVVHHIDSDKHNNDLSNLEIRGRREHNIYSGKQNLTNSRLSPEDVKDIRRMLSGGIKQHIIGFVFEVSQGAISQIATGKVWAWI